MSIMVDLPPAMAQEAREYATVQGTTLERMLFDCLVLLTWNCHHMANIVELPKTVRIVTQCGYECPMIITPKDYLEKINV